MRGEDDVLNPYASPRELTEFQLPEFEYFVQGNLLVVRDGSQLPDRCVLTNQPTGPKDRITQKLLGAPSFSFVLSRTKFRLTYSVCKQERRKSLIIRLVTIAIMLLAWFAIGNRTATLFIAIPVFVASALSKPNIFAVRKAHDGHYWLKGCGRDFFESIALEQAAVEAPLQADQNTGKSSGGFGKSETA